MRLSTQDHDRGAAGLEYVYPVVSRRAGGVSVGVNLNPNNACNWRCVYCQVPGLTFGKGPEIDLDRLRGELDGFLGELSSGDYMERHVPAEARVLRDLAFSGNGEPTSSPQFCEALGVAREVLEKHGLLGSLPIVLITNGSLVHQPDVQDGLTRLAAMNGEVWFKLDTVTPEGQVSINSNRAGPAKALSNLRASARLCPTWIQTCVFERRGSAPPESEIEAYLDCVEELVQEGVPLRGVHLYGLARPSYQPEADELAALPAAWMQALAARIETRGLEVRLSV